MRNVHYLGGRFNKRRLSSDVGVATLVQPNHIVHRCSGASLACRKRRSSITLDRAEKRLIFMTEKA